MSIANHLEAPDPESDFLDDIVDQRARSNPAIPLMVEGSLQARLLMRSLAARRRELGLSQTVVAARMGTSQSALARVESGESNPRLATVMRYALVLGEQVEHRRKLA